MHQILIFLLYSGIKPEHANDVLHDINLTKEADTGWEVYP